MGLMYVMALVDQSAVVERKDKAVARVFEAQQKYCKNNQQRFEK